MKFEDLIRIIRHEPLFSTTFLLAGEVLPAQIRLQLSRWVKAGRLYQLRRGLYSLAPPWRKVLPHPFFIANRLQRGSYVSLQSALAYYGVIPEHVPVVTSVGPGRPEVIENPTGAYLFKHISPGLQFGYGRVEVAPNQFAFIASPEKALLDLIYLTPGADSPEYLNELRLQNPDAINGTTLGEMVARTGKPKLIRAFQRVTPILEAQRRVAL